MESIKAEVATGVALGRELRDAVRNYTEAVGALAHSMCWLTWDCKARERLNGEMVEGYDIEVHRLSPQIISQPAVVSMLNRASERSWLRLRAECCVFDGKIGEAVVAAEANLAIGLPLLVGLHRRCASSRTHFGLKC